MPQRASENKCRKKRARGARVERSIFYGVTRSPFSRAALNLIIYLKNAAVPESYVGIFLCGNEEGFKMNSEDDSLCKICVIFFKKCFFII